MSGLGDAERVTVSVEEHVVHTMTFHTASLAAELGISREQFNTLSDEDVWDRMCNCQLDEPLYTSGGLAVQKREVSLTPEP